MIIGWTGNSGRSTGAHLHFDVKELIPNSAGKYAGLGDKYNQMYPDNGTFGTIRIDEWMEDVFVFETLSLVDKMNRLLIQLIKTITYK
jgi:murein DD-endopeptidase MepM/ murein hydrolase activator NlpD